MRNCLVIVSAFLALALLACSSKSTETRTKFHLAEEEYSWLDQFLRYFMLNETAVYTLAGSKPLTLFSLQIKQDNGSDDFETLWEKWEKIRHRLPLKKRFLLIKRERPADQWKTVWPECTAFYDIIFVDVLKTALAIQENYELFRQAVGYDFDPMATVFELANVHSDFWDKIQDCRFSYLWGILYGFGKDNSFSYFWKGRHMKGLHAHEQEKLFAESLRTTCSYKDHSPDCKNAEITLSNLSIPVFASFSDSDPMIAKYQFEKKTIQQLYKGKDFVGFTLELLTDTELVPGDLEIHDEDFSRDDHAIDEKNYPQRQK